MRRSHPGRSDEDTTAAGSSSCSAGAPAATQPPGFILYAISALDDLTGMTWSPEDLRDARLGRDDAVLECKLWYALFAIVSRSRMEAQGVEGAWTVSLESAMRAYVSRGKPGDVLKMACRRHIVTSFPGAAPALLPLLTPPEHPPTHTSHHRHDPRHDSRHDPRHDSRYDSRYDSRHDPRNGQRDDRRDDRQSSSSSSSPPPRPATASLFFALLWLIGAHDALGLRAHALHHHALNELETQGHIRPPPWGHDTWGMPQHVAQVARQCIQRPAGQAGARGRGEAADASTLSNRAIFLYNRVRLNLMAEESLRAQRQRLLQRAKEASQGEQMSAMEFWVVAEEGRVQRAIESMERATKTLEALRGVGKHEQNLWKWLGKGLTDLKLQTNREGEGEETGLPSTLYQELEASRFYLEWLDKVMSTRQAKAGASSRQRPSVLSRTQGTAMSKYKSSSKRWLEYLYGDRAPGRRREEGAASLAEMNPKVDSYRDVLQKLVAVSQSAMPGWEVLENGASIS